MPGEKGEIELKFLRFGKRWCKRLKAETVSFGRAKF